MPRSLEPYAGRVAIELATQPNPQSVLISDKVSARPTKIIIQENFNKWKHCEFYFQSFTTNFLDITLKAVMLQSIPTLYFRIGVESGNSTLWRPWERHIVTGFQAKSWSGGTSQGGHFFKLDTCDDLYRLHRAPKVISRKGSISQIIQGILDENKVQTVVETTQGDQKSYIQSFETDYSLVTRLRNRAINAAGRGNYRFYIKDGLFHFHTPDFQSQEALNLNYTNSTAMKKLIFNDSVQTIEGWAGVQVVSYDPLEGVAKNISSDPSKSLLYAKVFPKPTDWISYMPKHVGVNRGEEVGISQTAYDDRRSMFYDANFFFRQNPFLSLNDFINLTVTGVNSPSAWSGVYAVSQLRSVIAKGVCTTQVFLQRGELESTQSNFSKIPEALQENREEFFAPGSPVNPASVKSSRQTQGGATIGANGESLKPVVSSE